jgi:CheY-like chemotaxis protein
MPDRLTACSAKHFYRRNAGTASSANFVPFSTFPLELNVPNILIADDNPVDLKLMQGLLKKQKDWHVDTVTSGHAAIAWIQRQMPDSKLQSHGQQTTATPPRRPSILVTDLQMPNMDGIELVREVKRTDPGLPILLITSSQNMDVAEAALRAGATSFSPKHSLATDLVGTITQVLDVAQRMRYTHSETFCAVPEHQAFVLNNEASLIGPTIENLQNGLPKWSQADRLQIGMAVEEALTNAMHHGNLEVSSELRDGDTEAGYYQAIAQRKDLAQFRRRKVRVEAEYSDDHICIQISDQGAGFNPKSVPDPRLHENLDRVSGRGLLLIRSFMDQVAHNAAGNQITMTKLRKADGGQDTGLKDSAASSPSSRIP